MKELKELLEYLVKEGGVVLNAPFTFALLAVLMCAVAYLAATWLYKGIISNKDSEISLLRAQRDDYREKLGGATPDQAKARIDALEARLDVVQKRREPMWTPFIKVDVSKLVPPPPMVRSAKIQINLWSDDNSIPLMVRVAAKPDGSMMSEVTGPSAVVEVPMGMVEDQAIYVSFSDPSIKYKLGVLGFELNL